MSWPAYPQYKEASAYWLDRVPAHWEMQKMRRVCGLTTGWTPPTGDDASYEGENPWANISDLGARILALPEKSISDGAVRASRISLSPKGSLLFSFKLSVGQVSFAGCDMYTNEAIATFRSTENLDLNFAYYLFPYALVKNANENIYGAKLLNQELMNSARIPLPPIDEQGSISHFLDRETGKIDALIDKQHQLIETLREDRAATITHAVTKGLNPNAEMKDSGIDWIGLMPSAWSLKRLSWLFSTISSGTTPNSDRAEYYGGDTNWVTTGELRENIVSNTKRKVTQQALEDHSPLIVYPAGSLMIAMYGATIGRLGILGEPACVNQACTVFSEPVKIKSEFAFYALLAARAHLVFLASGGGQPNINQEKLRSLRIPVPTVIEQTEIVDRITESVQQVDELISAAERMLQTLAEHRSALITAAVTGKIDVRAAA